MLTLVLNRYLKTVGQGIFGKIPMPSGWTLFTGELKEDNDLPDISCIPIGTYLVQWLFSESHKAFVYHVMNVPGRDSVEMHSGNFCGDTSIKDARGNQLYWSDVLGCIIGGLSQGQVVNRFGNEQEAVISSKAAMAKFEKELQTPDGTQQSFYLQIVEDFAMAA